MDRRTIFERDGFVALSSFYREDELQNIDRTMENSITKRLPALPPKHVLYEEKTNLTTPKQIQCMHDHDGFFADLFNDKPKQLAKELQALFH
mgnify:CR=1 FL=1|tara:strand:- start:331 stop:606 length:276 start_codon:yes stop_codon:yes gene_type:complete